MNQSAKCSEDAGAAVDTINCASPRSERQKEAVERTSSLLSG